MVLERIETHDDTLGPGTWSSCMVVPLVLPVDPLDGGPLDGPYGMA